MQRGGRKGKAGGLCRSENVEEVVLSQMCRARRLLLPLHTQIAGAQTGCVHPAARRELLSWVVFSCCSWGEALKLEAGGGCGRAEEGGDSVLNCSVCLFLTSNPGSFTLPHAKKKEETPFKAGSRGAQG